MSEMHSFTGIPRLTVEVFKRQEHAECASHVHKVMAAEFY